MQRFEKDHLMQFKRRVYLGAKANSASQFVQQWRDQPCGLTVARAPVIPLCCCGWAAAQA